MPLISLPAVWRDWKPVAAPLERQVMFGAESITRTRFTPPRLRPNVIPRPQLMARLDEAASYPVTLIKADPGYGKSTLLSQFATHTGLQTFWYSLAEGDADPLAYLLNLIHLFRATYPNCGDKALKLLQQEAGAGQRWGPAINLFVNDLLHYLPADTLLILDDYQLVNIPPINDITERFIERMPPQLHLIFAARHTPNWQGRVRWRAYGELLELTRADLAFTPDEIITLFAQRSRKTITLREAETLASETEGWIIALQLLGERLANQAAGKQGMTDALSRLPGQLDALFDVLTEEVLAQHSPEMRRFMAVTSILPQMDAAVCDFVRGQADSQEFLADLEQHSLFLVRLGPNSFRYHQLFSDFLSRRSGLEAGQRRFYHGQAAVYYLEHDQLEEAIFHLLEAGEFERAAEKISDIAPEMAQSGRFRRLAKWIDAIPAALLPAYPNLLVERGDIYRFHSQFERAFGCYEKARDYYRDQGCNQGQASALKGQALIYIDTVQPRLAAPLLEQALDVVNRSAYQERGQLLLLLAENKINQGRLAAGERLYRRIYQLCGYQQIPQVDPRLSFRSGRLEETRQTLARMLKQDPLSRGGRRAPRSHREAILISAWVEAYLGNAELARSQAEQGIQLGEDLNSPIVKIVALQRLGHAWLAGPDYNLTRATEAYEVALELASAVNLPRFSEESLWGLTLIEGLQGQFQPARTHARQAVKILEAAGDAYWAWLCRLALGIAAVLTRQNTAPELLNQAMRQGEAIGDHYGLCVGQLWLALHYVQTGQVSEAVGPLRQALSLAQANQYQHLFTRITMLGPKDPGRLAALLSILPPGDPLARLATTLYAQLQDSIGAAVGFGPGREARSYVPLYIQTLGSFKVWYNGQEIPPAAWRRDKALRLFQLLVTYRHSPNPLHREKILGLLWSDVPSKSASNGLRVALSSLRQTFATGPAGSPGQQELPFLRREGTLLGLDMSGGILVDADQFVLLIKEARRQKNNEPERAIELYRQVADLYQGDYLQDCPYSDWAIEERERLLDLHLSAAEDLASLLYEQGNFNQAVTLCHHILDYDPLWEEAYRLMMRSYYQQGNRSLALRAYQRCVRRLKETLDVEPARETRELFQTILTTDLPSP